MGNGFQGFFEKFPETVFPKGRGGDSHRFHKKIQKSLGFDHGNSSWLFAGGFKKSR
jgi:hypothetical protein